MAIEIRNRIFGFVVAVEEPIVPHQIREKSNKFVWSKDQFNSNTKNYVVNVGAVKSLDVFALSAVCKQIYEEVALTNVCLFHTLTKKSRQRSRNVEKLTFPALLPREPFRVRL